MSTALEKLFFQVAMIDKVSEPAKKVTKHIDTMKSHAMGGFTKIAQGTAGLAGSGAALYAMISPARQLNKALGEVASLDVSTKELKTLEETALSFQSNFGGSASDFARSAYDIQSAIAGLDNGELAKFTSASAVLAKGTKADVGTITNYMGTMYGIFEHDAKAMGKNNWVEMIAGQTAQAVKMFKTTGSEMSSAFSALGSTGQAAGVSMTEQLGILGTLQATMSGSEAATKYKSFLNGVGSAQEKLGLQFTDSQGKMLPMVDILNKIKGKFGDTLDVAEGDALKKAFGSDEATALIKGLLNKTDSLKTSIGDLGKIKNMDGAFKMAESMVDPLDKIIGSSKSAYTKFSQFTYEAVQPFFAIVGNGFGMLNNWIDANPKLTKTIALMAVGVVALVASISSLLMIGGAIQLAMSAWSGIMVAYTAVQAIATGGAWAFTTALLANPITWVVVGVLALIAALASVVVYWDDITTAFSDWWSLTVDGMAFVWQFIKETWNSLSELFMNSFIGEAITNHIKRIITAFGVLKQFGTLLWNHIKGVFASIGGIIGKVFNKLAVLPGLSFLAETKIAKPAVNPPSAQQAKTLDIPAGGLQQSINNNGTSFGDVTIHSQNAPSPAQLEEYAMLGA